MSLLDLSAAFPADMIHWRAQTVTKQEPFKAMALAYIDARDVMARLDHAIGPENWQDSYAETASGRVICTLSIRIDGEWVSKADGSGDSDIEGEKGGISGAFKRAAVKWGIGRYLYDMPCPWVECEVYNGKWKKWTPAGLQQLRKVAMGGGGEPSNVPEVSKAPVGLITSDQRDIIQQLAEAAGVTLIQICEREKIDALPKLPAARFDGVVSKLKKTIDAHKQKEAA